MYRYIISDDSNGWDCRKTIEISRPYLNKEKCINAAIKKVEKYNRKTGTEKYIYEVM